MIVRVFSIIFGVELLQTNHFNFVLGNPE